MVARSPFSLSVVLGESSSSIRLAPTKTTATYHSSNNNSHVNDDKK
jgi:hypothetical protein